MDHVAEWTVRIYIFEHDDNTTYARAELVAKAAKLTAEGTARRRPTDPAVPEIGDELAAGRALVALGEQLLDTAADDIAAVG